MYQFSALSIDRMTGVNTRLIEITHRAIELSRVDFGIPGDGGVRTAERQRQLFDERRSKCDGVNKVSEHQSGRALDVYAYVNRKATWDEAHLTTVAAAMLQAASELGYGLQWGGHWQTFCDMPHFQLVER